MQEVFRAIGRLAALARDRAHHRASRAPARSSWRAPCTATARAPRRAFIAINTAAIPKDLLESELFGHERGAFTGAQAMRRGRFEQAEGGTLFLDEIGDMPPDLQTRLLRVLSDGQFYRVGGHTPITANVRVIAATHQDLEARVRQGLFREDLFHRLNVIRLRLPSLRERREDIPVLARHFLAKSARELGVEGKRLTDAAVQFLATRELPGNVRQLENLCHWVTVMAPGQVVDVADLPPEIRGEAPGPAPRARGTGARALEREVTARLARGETGIADAAHARLRDRAHRAGAGPHRRAAHRGGEPAGHRPQHPHPQGPGTADRREGLTLAARVAAREVRRRQRRAREEALVLVAAQGAQRVELRLGLHALGDHREPSECAIAMMARDDRLVVRVELDVAHERAVDLDRVHRQRLQVGERRVAGAEVVDRRCPPRARPGG